MTFLVIPSIGTLAFDASTFLSAHPGLVHEIAGHSLAHVLYSYIKRSGKRHGLSRREIRKATNRRRRWFVDNIIMHHKRLHDHSRKILVSNARSRAIARRDAGKKENLSLQKSSDLQKNQNAEMKWCNSVSLKDKGIQLRGRIDAERKRARSRWLSLAESKN